MHQPVNISVASKSSLTEELASGRTRRRFALGYGLEDWAAAEMHIEKRQIYEPLFVGIGVSAPTTALS